MRSTDGIKSRLAQMLGEYYSEKQLPSNATGFA